MLSSNQARATLSVPRTKFLHFPNVTTHAKQDTHFLWNICSARPKAEVHPQIRKISYCVVSARSRAHYADQHWDIIRKFFYIAYLTEAANKFTLLILWIHPHIAFFHVEFSDRLKAVQQGACISPPPITLTQVLSITILIPVLRKITWSLIWKMSNNDMI